jgi:hypothetical protein
MSKAATVLQRHLSQELVEVQRRRTRSTLTVIRVTLAFYSVT